jgi:Tfp pilus assembly protein PilF
MKFLSAVTALFVIVSVGSAQNTLEEFQKILESNPRSSTAHYGKARIFLQERNYQSSANEFREALNGDLQPAWIEVWSHINLGKIFDSTNQRDRAVNEYTQAIRTRDDTDGALEEAARYLESPYKPSSLPHCGGACLTAQRLASTSL